MRRFVLNFINTICPRFLTRFYLPFCVNLISFVGIRGDAAGFLCSPYASVAGLLDDARFGGRSLRPGRKVAADLAILIGAASATCMDSCEAEEQGMER